MSNELTPERLDELQRLHEAATPGPWNPGREWNEGECQCFYFGTDIDEFGDRKRAMTDDDFRLAAAIRNDFDALLRMARRSVELERECIGLTKANALLNRGMEVSEEERMRLKLELRKDQSCTP